MDEMDEPMIRLLASALHQFDELLFPTDAIQLCIAETDGGGSILRYVPDRALARASGIPELSLSNADAEQYLIFSADFAMRLGSVLEVYEFFYAQFYPDFACPSVEDVLVGMASHEVRHRFQLHRRPRLFSPDKQVSGAAVIADHLLACQEPIQVGASRQAKDHERDARIIEVLMVQQFIKNPAVTNEDLLKILTLEP